MLAAQMMALFHLAAHRVPRKLSFHTFGSCPEEELPIAVSVAARGASWDGYARRERVTAVPRVRGRG